METYYFVAKTKLNDYFYFTIKRKNKPSDYTLASLMKKYNFIYIKEIDMEVFNNGIKRNKANC